LKRRFLARLILFGLPVAAVLSIPVAFAIHMGEALPVRAIVTMQQGDTPILYGPTDREPILAYKLLATQTRQPDVLIIGSSRVLQFRSQFFDRNPAAFYNAGGEGWGIDEIHTLVGHLDAAHAPKILLVGLDQVWFDQDYVSWEEPPILKTDDVNVSFERLIPSTRKLIDTLIAGDVQWGDVLDPHEYINHSVGLGLDALQGARGYRNDGSHQEGDLLQNPALGDLARKHDIDKAPEGWRQFVQGNDVAEPMMQQLDSFLQLAQSKGMTVIGFGPPFMPTIVQIMRDGGKTEYLPKSATEIEALFAQRGFHYFDFTDPTAIGGSDGEMYDGWHASELLSLREYIAMLKALPDALGPYSDLNALETTAAQADNPLIVFGQPS
jgi:hypothetical protein